MKIIYHLIFTRLAFITKNKNDCRGEGKVPSFTGKVPFTTGGNTDLFSFFGKQYGHSSKKYIGTELP